MILVPLHSTAYKLPMHIFLDNNNSIQDSALFLLELESVMAVLKGPYLKFSQ